ncbi:MAG: uncharacterized protein QOH39_696 [Verrucomicrobiota bacterium]|jgi:uncharacterized protein
MVGLSRQESWTLRRSIPTFINPVKRIVFCLAILLAGIVSPAYADEVVPPKPERYFNDYAGVVSPGASSRFDAQLAQFERETSNQVVVAVFRKMQSDSDVADYTQRVAQSWKVGQQDRRNGAVLFVFIEDRKMFIQVGYGLEAVLPDVTAFDITEYHIKPHFKNNDYEGGLGEGIDLICKAIRGEYKGTGHTLGERQSQKSGNWGGVICFLIFIIVLIFIGRKSRRRGFGYSGFGGPFIGGWSSGSGGGGGWSSGGGGGFSGGGGSFGGGGAGSSW